MTETPTEAPIDVDDVEAADDDSASYTTETVDHAAGVFKRVEPRHNNVQQQHIRR